MANNVVSVDEQVVRMKVEMNELVYEIRELEESMLEMQELYKAQAEALNDKFEDKKLLLKTRKERLTGQLRVLFEQVPQHETKTQRKVILLEGDVIVKKPKKDFEKDTDKLIEWAKVANREDLLTRKEVVSFKWADFKKSIIATESGIIEAETGETIEVEGLIPITKEEALEIKY